MIGSNLYNNDSSMLRNFDNTEHSDIQQQKQTIISSTDLNNDPIISYKILNAEEMIFLADMDGTLTPARSPMTEEFEKFFLQFLETHTFFVVSGSDISKVKEQLSSNILDKIDGLFCSMGNQFYRGNTLVYSNDFQPNPELINLLESYRRNTNYTGQLFDNYIEYRPGMLNFSVLGRNCPRDQRVLYKQWDTVNLERDHIADELKKRFPQYDISVGGNISIDIVPHGFGKEQVAKKVRNLYPNNKITFIGDRIAKGGNDYSLAEALKKQGNAQIVPVQDYKDTLNFLKDIK